MATPVSTVSFSCSCINIQLVTLLLMKLCFFSSSPVGCFNARSTSRYNLFLLVSIVGEPAPQRHLSGLFAVLLGACNSRLFLVVGPYSDFSLCVLTTTLRLSSPSPLDPVSKTKICLMPERSFFSFFPFGFLILQALHFLTIQQRESFLILFSFVKCHSFQPGKLFSSCLRTSIPFLSSAPQ